MFNPAAVILLGVLLMFYENFLSSKANEKGFPLTFCGYSIIAVGFAWWWLIPGTPDSIPTIIELNWDQETAKLISALAKLAWPLVALIAVLIFKSKFATAIDRVISFTLPGGAGVGFAAGQANTPIPYNINQSPQYATLKPFTKSWVDKIEADTNQLATHDKETLLKIYGGVITVKAEFERIYGAIWGSQISTVQFLRVQHEPANVNAFYERHISEVKNLPKPPQPIDFVGWANFLVTNSLIEEPVLGSREYKITEKGKEFVDFMIENQRSLTKAF